MSETDPSIIERNVEKVRDLRTQAGAQAGQVQSELARLRGKRFELDTKALTERARTVPTEALSRSIELAGKAEEAYGELERFGSRVLVMARAGWRRRATTGRSGS